MQQQLSDQKVHSLDIVGLIVVTGKGSQDIAELLVARLSWIEKLVLRKCPAEVPVNLQCRLLLRLQLLQAFVVLLAFLILIQYDLGDIDLIIQFLLPPYLERDDIGSEPPDAILACKGVRGVLVTVAIYLVLQLLQFRANT